MTVALSWDAVFAGDVVAERFFSADAVLFIAARADFARSVSDDPGGVALPFALGVDLLGFKPESRRC